MQATAGTTTEPLLTPEDKRGHVSRGLVLVVGVFLVPGALTLIFNSWGPLTNESALRMAFASIAGQTIAILSAVTVLVMTMLRRRWRDLPLFVVIALLICSGASASMGNTGDMLMNRFERVAEVDRLNG